MTGDRLRHRQTLLQETLLSALDARETAREVASPMLLYLADLLVTRATEEAGQIRAAIEKLGADVGGDEPI